MSTVNCLFLMVIIAGQMMRHDFFLGEGRLVLCQLLLFPCKVLI